MVSYLPVTNGRWYVRTNGRWYVRLYDTYRYYTHQIQIVYYVQEIHLIPNYERVGNVVAEAIWSSMLIASNCIYPYNLIQLHAYLTSIGQRMPLIDVESTLEHNWLTGAIECHPFSVHVSMLHCTGCRVWKQRVDGVCSKTSSSSSSSCSSSLKSAASYQPSSTPPSGTSL